MNNDGSHGIIFWDYIGLYWGEWGLTTSYIMGIRWEYHGNTMGVSIVMGVSKMVGLWGTIPLTWMIWGYLYFRKPSNNYSVMETSLTLANLFLHEIFWIYGTLQSWKEIQWEETWKDTFGAWNINLGEICMPRMVLVVVSLWSLHSNIMEH